MALLNKNVHTNNQIAKHQIISFFQSSYHDLAFNNNPMVGLPSLRFPLCSLNQKQNPQLTISLKLLEKSQKCYKYEVIRTL